MAEDALEVDIKVVLAAVNVVKAPAVDVAMAATVAEEVFETSLENAEKIVLNAEKNGKERPQFGAFLS